MTATIAIVDPYFSGGGFPAIAESLGYRALWIRSNPSIPLPDPPVMPKHFLRYGGDLDALVAHCRTLDVRAAFAGCENGVLLADALSEALGLPSNGTSLSLARRHKGEMKKALSAAGVPCARFASIRSPERDAALAAMAAAELTFPVVIKPPMGFSALGVFTCTDEAELAAGLSALAGLDLTPFDIACDEILIEEYIDGEQFAVDTMGDGSATSVTDAWRYALVTFSGRRNICRSAHLLPPDDGAMGAIVPTALAADAALGIRVGPAHVELKLSSRGPRIIEVGARIIGAQLAGLARVATGADLEAATVRAFLGEPAALAPMYRCDRRAAVAVLMTAAQGEIQRIHGVEAIERLPSFVRHFLRARLGQRVVPTVDLVTSPGLVHLAHENAEQVRLDAEACHRLFNLEVTP